MFMERHCRVSLGYGELACVVRVQSVTRAAMVDCPCDWWWLVLSCSPSDPVSRAGSPSPLIPLPSRERGFHLAAALWIPAYAGMTGCI